MTATDAGIMPLVVQLGRLRAATADVPAVLTRVCTAIPGALAVGGALLLVVDPPDGVPALTASDGRARWFGEVQQRAGMGPLPGAVRTWRAMLTSDLTRIGPPAVAAAATEGGLGSSLVLPMDVDGERIGVLQLLGEAQRPVEPAHADMLQSLLDVLAARLADVKALRRAGGTAASRQPEQTGTGTTSVPPVRPAPAAPLPDPRGPYATNGAAHPDPRVTFTANGAAVPDPRVARTDDHPAALRWHTPPPPGATVRSDHTLPPAAARPNGVLSPGAVGRGNGAIQPGAASRPDGAASPGAAWPGTVPPGAVAPASPPVTPAAFAAPGWAAGGPPSGAHRHAIAGPPSTPPPTTGQVPGRASRVSDVPAVITGQAVPTAPPAATSRAGATMSAVTGRAPGTMSSAAATGRPAAASPPGATSAPAVASAHAAASPPGVPTPPADASGATARAAEHVARRQGAHAREAGPTESTTHALPAVSGGRAAPRRGAADGAARPETSPSISPVLPPSGRRRGRHSA